MDKPSMMHCDRCELDYPSGLQHPAEECINRKPLQVPRDTWPPQLETKEQRLLLVGDWKDIREEK